MHKAPTVISVKKSNLKLLGYDSLEDWLKDPTHIYIGRDMQRFIKGAIGSKWRNPYSIKKYKLNEALLLYKEYLLGNKELLNSLYELNGKVLGCWCVEVGMKSNNIVCHGTILANLFRDIFCK